MSVPQDSPILGNLSVEACTDRPCIRALDREFADPLTRKREIVQPVHAAAPQRRIAHVLVEEDAARLNPSKRVDERLPLRCGRNVMHHVDHRDGAVEPIGKANLDRTMLEGELRGGTQAAESLRGGVRRRDGGFGRVDAVSARNAPGGRQTCQEEPAAAADVEDIGALRYELDASCDRRDAVTVMLQHALEERAIREHPSRDGADIAAGLRVRAAGR